MRMMVGGIIVMVLGFVCSSASVSAKRVTVESGDSVSAKQVTVKSEANVAFDVGDANDAKQRDGTFFGMAHVVVESGELKHEFVVEVADSSQDRAIGLMYRRSLGEHGDGGMLFDFLKEKPVSMWMKNTYIPLDMFFISADGVIRRIEEYTVPFSDSPIFSGVSVRYVLEVDGGTANRLRIVPGDKVPLAWMSR